MIKCISVIFIYLIKSKTNGQKCVEQKSHLSLPFIRTNNITWGFANEIDQSLGKNIPTMNIDKPIISCIGTSRDGKSTFLNVYTNFLLKENNKLPFNPFISNEGDIVVTNGIDYYDVDNDCILFDCQGIQLDNAKYDHYF